MLDVHVLLCCQKCFRPLRKLLYSAVCALARICAHETSAAVEHHSLFVRTTESHSHKRRNTDAEFCFSVALFVCLEGQFWRPASTSAVGVVRGGDAGPGQTPFGHQSIQTVYIMRVCKSSCSGGLLASLCPKFASTHACLWCCALSIHAEAAATDNTARTKILNVMWTFSLCTFVVQKRIRC